MRNSFIIIIFAFVSLFISTNLVAQTGKTSVSIGSGQFFNSTQSFTNSSSFFVTSTTKQTSQFTPLIALKLERRVLKHFSIGLTYSTLTAKSERTTNSGALRLLFLLPATTTHETIDSKISGVSMNLKGFVYSNTDFQAYIGTSIGILKNQERITKTRSSQTNISEQINAPSTEHNITALTEFNVGVRYFATPNIGLYGEIGGTSVYGMGGASGQLGVICRF